MTALVVLVSPASAAVVDLPHQAPAEAAFSRALSGGVTVDRVIRDDRIKESSGLARSTYSRNVLFTHNDSGGGKKVYAVNGAGRTAAVLTLDRAATRDLEDIAAGPDHSLWLGDIGDNRRQRDQIRVYRFTEPAKLATRAVAWTRYRFRYADRAHDAEALLVHPRSGRLYVVSKARTNGGIYRAPAVLSRTKVNRLTRIADAPAQVTAGAFSPDGSGFVLRNRDWAWLYDCFQCKPERVRLPDQRSGESITFERSGEALLAGSEGARSPVHRIPLAQKEAATWQPKPPKVPTNGVVRPERFGAVGDGKHDDGRALQRAIDAAARQGKKVQLADRRTYLSSRRLDLPSGTYLYGGGRTSKLKFTWRKNDPEHDGYYIGNRDQLTGNTDISLHSFAIVGAGDGYPAGPKSDGRQPNVPAIRLRLVDRFVIKRLEVSYAPGISIIYQGCSHGRVVHNLIHHSGRDGINSTWHKRNLHHVLVARNRIRLIGDDGIAVIGAPGNRPNTSELPYNIAVRNNVIRGWPQNPNGQLLGRGLVVLAATHVEFSGNLVDRTHSHGVLIAPSTRAFSTDPATGEPWRSSDIDLIGNQILRAGQNYPGTDESIGEPGHDGITIKRSDRVRLQDNVIEDPYGRKLAMYDCRQCTVN